HLTGERLERRRFLGQISQKCGVETRQVVARTSPNASNRVDRLSRFHERLVDPVENRTTANWRGVFLGVDGDPQLTAQFRMERADAEQLTRVRIQRVTLDVGNDLDERLERRTRSRLRCRPRLTLALGRRRLLFGRARLER